MSTNSSITIILIDIFIYSLSFHRQGPLSYFSISGEPSAFSHDVKTSRYYHVLGNLFSVLLFALRFESSARLVVGPISKQATRFVNPHLCFTMLKITSANRSDRTWLKCSLRKNLFPTKVIHSALKIQKIFIHRHHWKESGN